ncbi:PREDICTED: zinc finger protein 775-like [Polistes dominula]|uniref:Zinc finger protein 775-like n=1 Tax=Polistes dominula TaxID=743375 RepID=A0ABM1IEF0_POLDO|nr:PREDICTED: zinc finger protein 775-like [Polistes dominula]
MRIGRITPRKVYSLQKSHYCPRCNRGFTQKKNMRRHLHHECGMEPKYQCPYCDKPSKFTQNIYAHIRRYHPGQTLHLTYECGKAPRFKCPHCVYIGKHRSHVYSHIKSNHYNRPVYAVDTQED